MDQAMDPNATNDEGPGIARASEGFRKFAEPPSRIELETYGLRSRGERPSMHGNAAFSH
jgi:hypothetical protein